MSDSPRLPARPSFEQLQKQAKDLLRQFRAGESSAVDRLRAVLSSPGDSATLADAQFVLAREYGFENWATLKHFVETAAPPETARYRIDAFEKMLTVEGAVSDEDWDRIAVLMAEGGIDAVRARGANDTTLGRIARLERLTRLDLDGATEITDQGMAQLAQLPRLTDLSLCGGQGRITDRGLEVLRALPELSRIRLCWQPNISDSGMPALGACDRLEDVDLMGTLTGDGALRALAGKPALHQLKTGRGVTDRGLYLLHAFPIFKTWQGGEPRYNLMSFTAGPNHLLIDGPFTNAGLTALVGLDGLFGLSFFWHSRMFTSSGLAALRQLPHLGFLGCQGARCDDGAMRQIAALPGLRMLMAQGTVAGDDGFAALSRSQSLEYLWGRECPNLTGRGFRALANLPSLRGLAVSCRNVDDDALALLPAFPALRELLPMDVPDEGFRHIGRCQRLDHLWCMYCRDTGDQATEHIAGLALRSYYAGQTRITDRSLEILSRMESLERLEFYACAGITDAGIARLARLPKLRKIGLQNMSGAGGNITGLFPPTVHVHC